MDSPAKYRLLSTVVVHKNESWSKPEGKNQKEQAESEIRKTMSNAVDAWHNKEKEEIKKKAVEDLEELKKLAAVKSAIDEQIGQSGSDIKLEYFSPHASLINEKLENGERTGPVVDNVRLLRFNRVKSKQIGPGGVALKDIEGEGIGHKRYSLQEYEKKAPPLEEYREGLRSLGKPYEKKLFLFYNRAYEEEIWDFEDLRFSEQPNELIALQLGDVDEWRLRVSDTDEFRVGHPFHIHINPFQIVGVTRLSDGIDLTSDETSQYFGMHGVFKDTIMVMPGVEVVIRSHYERYSERT